MHIRKLLVTLALLIAAHGAAAQSLGRRRAVLIGINDYTASRHPGPRPALLPERDWRNLTGAVNDVRIIQEMLTLLYGFRESDVVTLTDQEASRVAILEKLEQHLATPAAKGDVLLVYFAGHGSQVTNSLSDEPDHLDESIVPADSRLGVPDIRDKQLRQLFNRILDRGARLTVILDHCYSGSGARGLGTGERHRGIKRDPRDVADRTKYGPRPEDRGALVLSATQDDEIAWEVRDKDKQAHGAFSWAWIRAMRASTSGESAAETFARAAAWMRNEKPFQKPVIAGQPDALYSPFLGVRTDRQDDRAVIAVEKVHDDGTVVLQGGWANGLAEGTELCVLNDDGTTARVTVNKILGLGRSEGSIPAGLPMPRTIRTGALMEVVGWAAPAGRPLRVWMPQVPEDAGSIAALGRKLSAEASRSGVRWIENPIGVTPSHILRRGSREWELLGPDGQIESLGLDSAKAIEAVAKLPAASKLFVQFPAPARLIDGIVVGPGSDREGIDPADRADDADYILAGRFSKQGLAYAWVRPAMNESDRRKAALPPHTAWTIAGRGDALRDTAGTLREAALRLRKIHAWHLLESPPPGRFAYRLGLRREPDREWARDSVIGDQQYQLVLRAVKPPAYVKPRFIYIFAIDSHGQSFLLFGTSSVENRFPRAPAAGPAAAPAEIPLGAAGTFHIAEPYGIDTYFLLTTDEPLPNPHVLEWDGVRSGWQPRSAVEELIVLTAAGSRTRRRSTPSTWSIERVYFESVPPRESKAAR